jgi:hypothetical protein
MDKMRKFEDKITLAMHSIDWSGVFGNDIQTIKELTKLLKQSKKNGFAETLGGNDFIDKKLEDLKFMSNLGGGLWG